MTIRDGLMFFLVGVLGCLAIFLLASLGLMLLPASAADDKPDCAVQLATMRAYADALRTDRDQKEGALIEYAQRVQILTAELAKLREPQAK